jgi:hypothetical protein
LMEQIHPQVWEEELVEDKFQASKQWEEEVESDDYKYI